MSDRLFALIGDILCDYDIFSVLIPHTGLRPDVCIV